MGSKRRKPTSSPDSTCSPKKQTSSSAAASTAAERRSRRAATANRDSSSATALSAVDGNTTVAITTRAAANASSSSRLSPSTSSEDRDRTSSSSDHSGEMKGTAPPVTKRRKVNASPSDDDEDFIPHKRQSKPSGKKNVNVRGEDRQKKTKKKSMPPPMTTDDDGLSEKEKRILKRLEQRDKTDEVLQKSLEETTPPQGAAAGDIDYSSLVDADVLRDSKLNLFTNSFAGSLRNIVRIHEENELRKKMELARRAKEKAKKGGSAAAAADAVPPPSVEEGGEVTPQEMEDALQVRPLFVDEKRDPEVMEHDLREQLREVMDKKPSTLMFFCASADDTIRAAGNRLALFVHWHRWKKLAAVKSIGVKGQLELLKNDQSLVDQLSGHLDYLCRSPMIRVSSKHKKTLAGGVEERAMMREPNTLKSYAKRLAFACLTVSLVSLSERQNNDKSTYDNLVGILAGSIEKYSRQLARGQIKVLQKNGFTLMDLLYFAQRPVALKWRNEVDLQATAAIMLMANMGLRPSTVEAEIPFSKSELVEKEKNMRDKMKRTKRNDEEGVEEEHGAEKFFDKLLNEYGSQDYPGLRWDVMRLTRLPPTEEFPFRIAAAVHAKRQKCQGTSSHDSVYDCCSKWPGRTPHLPNGAVGVLLLAVMADVIDWSVFYADANTIMKPRSLLVKDSAEKRLHRIPVLRAAEKGGGKMLSWAPTLDCRRLLAHAYTFFHLPKHMFSPKSLRIGFAENAVSSVLGAMPCDDTLVTKDTLFEHLRSTGAWKSDRAKVYIRNVVDTLEKRVKENNGTASVAEWRRAVFTASARARVQGGYNRSDPFKKDYRGLTNNAKTSIIGALDTVNWMQTNPEEGNEELDREIASRILDVERMALDARKYVTREYFPFEKLITAYYKDREGPYKCPVAGCDGEDSYVSCVQSAEKHMQDRHEKRTKLLYLCPCGYVDGTTEDGGPICYSTLRKHANEQHPLPKRAAVSPWNFSFRDEESHPNADENEICYDEYEDDEKEELFEPEEHEVVVGLLRGIATEDPREDAPPSPGSFAESVSELQQIPTQFEHDDEEEDSQGGRTNSSEMMMIRRHVVESTSSEEDSDSELPEESAADHQMQENEITDPFDDCFPVIQSDNDDDYITEPEYESSMEETSRSELSDYDEEERDGIVDDDF